MGMTATGIRLIAPLAGSLPARAATAPLRRGPIILAYHGVAPQILDRWVEQLHMPVATFERQMEHLIHTHEIVPLCRITDALGSGEPLDPRWAAVTFDDAYRNVASHAAPILRSLGIPFTVFISTQHVDSGDRFPTYVARVALSRAQAASASLASIGRTLDLRTVASRRAAYALTSNALKRSPLRTVRALVAELQALLNEEEWREQNARYANDAPMTWEDVSAVVRAGATVGSHAHDHALLHEGEQTEEIERQLARSKELISQHAGACDVIAYPNGQPGDVSKRALGAAREAGYTFGFSSYRGEVTPDSDPWLLPRVGAPSTLSLFKTVLNLRFLANRRFQRWSATVR